MISPGVVVTGLGVVTAAGVGVEAAWPRVCAGLPAAARDPALAGLPVDISCTVPEFDAKELVGPRSPLTHDRFVQLALVAAREAVADSGLEPTSWDGARVGVVVGSALGGVSTWERQHQRLLAGGARTVSPLLIPMMMHNMVAGHVAMEFGARGPNLVTATACASGATAVGTAFEMVRDGRCDVAITGGADAAVTPLTVAAFAKMGVLSRRLSEPRAASRPFDVGRDGFVIGEGSGFLVLEREADARARDAKIWGKMAGYGATADAYHMTTPDPAGAAVLDALDMALGAAGLMPDEVDYVNAHGTSTEVNDLTEARAIARALGNDVAVSSTKGVTGHALGAAGAIEAVFAVLAVRTGTIPPTANLECRDPAVELDIVANSARRHRVDVAVSNSFGFGGQNAVLAFTS